MHEQDFEGEVLGFRDDVMTWDLNQISGGAFRTVSTFFESRGRMNLTKAHNTRTNWSFFDRSKPVLRMINFANAT